MMRDGEARKIGNHTNCRDLCNVLCSLFHFSHSPFLLLELANAAISFVKGPPGWSTESFVHLINFLGCAVQDFDVRMYGVCTYCTYISERLGYDSDDWDLLGFSCPLWFACDRHCNRLVERWSLYRFVGIRSNGPGMARIMYIQY